MRRKLSYGWRNFNFAQDGSVRKQTGEEICSCPVYGMYSTLDNVGKLLVCVCQQSSMEDDTMKSEQRVLEFLGRIH